MNINADNKDEEFVTISTDDIEVKIPKSKFSSEVMTIIGELIEKTRVSRELERKTSVVNRLESIKPKILDDRDITEDELIEYSKKIPSLREIKNYIVKKDDFRHSFRDMQMEFLGMVFNQDDSVPNQQKIYRTFYSRLYRVHDKIQKEYGGIWKDETIAPIDEPKYKLWWFVEGEQKISLSSF